MADIPGGSDARVVIKIDVDDVAAKAKLKDLSRRLNSLEKDAGKSSKAFNTTSDRLQDVAESAGKATKNLAKQADEVGRIAKAYDRFMGRMREMNKLMGVIGSGFGALFKIIKYGAIEFGLLTAAVGAFKIALVSAQYIAKGWNAIIRGVGASAGVAVAAIASVFAAIRELQVAQMTPAYTGNGTVGGRAGQILGGREFAMFDQQTLNSIMQQQMTSGNKVDAAFQRRLQRLGDFTGGDAKSLQSLNQTFNEMKKKGKVTSEGYASLQKTSPALARAFEEMAGGAEKAASAAASGTISFSAFNEAVMKGELEALEPYNGALERINDTLVGRLKGSLKGLQEQFIDLGDDMLVHLKGPIAEVERAFSDFLFVITPTLQRIFPQLMQDSFGAGTNVLDKFLQKFAILINTNMPKLIGYGGRLRDSWRGFRDSLSGVGEYLERMTKGWDNLWNFVLGPLFEEIGTTFNHILDSFNNLLVDNSEALDRMGDSIRGVFNFLRELYDVFVDLKPILQFFATILLQMINVIGQGLGAGGLLGGFMRLTAAGGLLLMFFKKFIGRTAQFLRGGKEMYKRLTEIRKGADASASALNKMAGAMNNVAAANRNMNAAAAGAPASAAGAAASRVAMPLNPYAPNTYGGSEYRKGYETIGGYALSARRAAQAGYYGSLTAEQRQQGLNQSIAMGRASMLSTAPVMKQYDSIGQRMAIGFGKGVMKYNIAAGMAVGMIGSLITGGASQTNTTGQALGGAMSYGSMGAMIGSMFGPAGTLIGGVGGSLLGGFLGANAAEEARRREIEEAKKENDSLIATIMGEGGLFNSQRQIADVRRAAYLARERADFQRGGVRLAGNLDVMASSDLYQYGPATDFYQAMGYAPDEIYDNIFHKGGTEITTNDFGVGSENYNVVLNDVKTWLSGMGRSASQIDALIESEDTLMDVIAKVQEGRLEEIDSVVDTSESLEVINDRWNKLNNLMHLMDEYSGNLNQNLDAAVDIFGESAGEVTKMFNEMGKSLSETGVTISLLNETLGYTGDLANDVAIAAGRLRDELRSPLDDIRDTNEADRRLRAQLITFMESGVAGDMTVAEMEDLAADTVEQLLEQQLVRIAAGEITFQEAFGEDGRGGNFVAAVEQMGRDAAKYGVDTDLMDITTGQVGTVQDILADAVSNPFERMKYDAQFAQDFTRQIELAQAGAMAEIAAGGSASTALTSVTGGVVAWLEDNGFSDVNGDSIYNMISNGALEMAHVLEEAEASWVDSIAEGIRQGFGLGINSPSFVYGPNDPRNPGNAPALPTVEGANGNANQPVVTNNSNSITVNVEVPGGTSPNDIIADEIVKSLEELQERGYVMSVGPYVR